MTATGTNHLVTPQGPGDAETHRQRLLLLTCGLRLAYIVSALGELGIAEAVQDGPRTVDELATSTGADPDALYRVLRCAASVGIFTEVEERVFARTPLSDPLSAEARYSLRPLIDYSVKPFVAGPYAALAETLRSGRPATESVLGTDFWGYLETHPEDDAFFGSMMTRLGRWETDKHLDVVRPENYRRIVDLGGGHGHFLTEALRRAPEATGVLVERDAVLVEAAGVLGEAGVSDRVTPVAADLFTDELPAGDVYLLKAVLHNWPDERVSTALRRVRAAIGDRPAPLFIVEQVVAPGNAFDHAKFLDVDMLVLFGGRERTLDQWQDLLAPAGFRLANDPERGRWTVLHLEPV